MLGSKGTKGTKASNGSRGAAVLSVDESDVAALLGARGGSHGSHGSVASGGSTASGPFPDGIVHGTSGDDLIIAGYTDSNGDMVDGNDAILPGEFGDDDIIYAGDGNDIVRAGDGDDEIYGGAGDDLLVGGDGNDDIYGQSGSDAIYGQGGDDNLYGGSGYEEIYGGDGDDFIRGGTGADYLSGGAGDDKIIGDGGNANGYPVTLTFLGEEAGYLNTIGIYSIDPDTGEISNVELAFENASATGSGGNLTPGVSQYEYMAEPCTEIGVFNIAQGFSLNDYAALGDGTFKFVNAAGDPATINDPTPTLIHVAPDGTETNLSGNIYHTPQAVQNPDGLVHVAPTGPDSFGIEDLLGGGDNDFDDPLLGIDLGQSGTSFSIPGMTLTSELPVDNTGEADDVIDGGTGDDTIIAGNGDDIVTGGDGNDTVDGGNGDDVIDTSGTTQPLPDIGFPGLYPADTDPNNDKDVVSGGAGNDTIITGDDDDIIDGGSGNDTINAGIDEDIVDGGAGDDIITGGEGNDTIDGGDGNDTIYGGLGPGFPDSINITDDGSDGSIFGPDPVTNNGMDVIDGGAGDDIIYGEDDDDTIFGGSGDDFIDAGIDDDVVLGGTGNDTIIGGQGTDTLAGGDDRDTFIGGNAGDVIDGGGGGDDFDTLDLSGVAGPINIVYTSADQEDGYVEFGGSTDPADRLTFTEVESIIPCFTPGSRVATPRGEVAVEDLKAGDRVITRDNGFQEIQWVGHKKVSLKTFAQDPSLKPILIRAGSIGKGLPERDMIVSPNHRMLLTGPALAVQFDEPEVLVAAKHLVGRDGIHRVDMLSTTYIHFMFDHHEVVLADGAWSESFQPGDYSLKGIDQDQRSEIFTLFPELKSRSGRQDYVAARPVLKAFEAKLLG